jgi:HEAT repeat protein
MAGIELEESLLLEIFLASSANTKRVIVQHISTLAGGHNGSLLKNALRDIDGHVRGDGVAVIGDLGLQGYTRDLASIAKQDFFDVRVKALQSLMKLDSTRAVELTEEFVGHGSSEDKRLYLATAGRLDSNTNLPLVSVLLRDDDEAVRRAAVGVVGDFLYDSRYVDLVRDLLAGENIIHEVLKVVKDKSLTEFKDRLIEIFMAGDKGLWTRYYALSALGAFEDRSLFHTLLKGLEDENSLIKIGSLKALADLGDERALQYVEPFVLNPDEDIRSTAEFVMSRFRQP